MTNPEFNNEFDIEYNSISSNAASPLDEYEKSVFLTQAQERIVKELSESFDNKEKNRRELANLITNAVSTTPLSFPSDFINQRSRFFNLNQDVMYIVNERVKLSSSDPCYNNNTTNVIPVRHDEYNKLIKNPFKKPNGNVSWRLDYKNLNNNKTVEILTLENTTASEYHYRYIKYPKPIILTNLTGLSINGISVSTECELAESLHRQILDLAVVLALEASGNPRLKTKPMIDKSV